MVRKKLAAVVAALSATQANIAGALGLGEFSLNSALNQPLNGEIRLLNVGDLSESQVIVSLASNEDFQRAGVSRDFFLTNIKFDVELDENGNGVIKLSSRESVVEPYLNFLVEARWPNGRLLREYTVLLDLPIYSESAVKATAAPTRSVTAAPSQQQQATTAAAPAARSLPASSPRKTLSEGSMAAGSTYRVKQGDTLWEVAAKAKPSSSTSVQQTMVGIQRLNPNAFMKGNINNLKAGYVLRLPTETEIKDISERSAKAEVANQNQAWRTGETPEPKPSTGPALDATATTGNRDEQLAASARLSLSTSGADTSSTAGEGESAAGTGSAALQNQLTATEENLDASKRENEELQSRLQDMEERLATMQRLLELKEDELAALAAKSTEKAEAESPTADTAAKQTEQAAQPKPAPVPAKPAAPASEPGMLENPLYIGIAAALAAILAVFAILRRRKADEEEVLELVEEQDETLSDVALDDTDIEEAEEELSVGDFADEFVAESDTVVQPASDETPPEETAPVQSETGDAIAEADIYIAYGRYQQAIDLLTSAIDQDPQRAALQIKLLEVYLETRDKPGFQQQYQTLQGLGDSDAIDQVKELLSTVDGASDWLDDLAAAGTAELTDADMDSELIEGDGEAELVLDETPTQEVEAVGDGFELDLDEAELELDGDIEALDTEKTLQFETVDLEAELDTAEEFALDGDELDLETDASSESVAEAAVESDDTLLSEEVSAEQLEDEGFELDLDGDTELDMELGELDDSALGELEAEFDDADIDSDEFEVDFSAELDTESDAEETESVELDVEAPEGIDFTEPEAEEAELSETAVEESFEQEVEASDEQDDLDFLSDTDEVATKLDLARAYIDMGDTEGAKDILDEVLQEGNDEQKQEASALLERI